MLGIINKNILVLSIVITGLVVAGAIIGTFFFLNQGEGNFSEETSDPQELAEKTVTFVNEILLTEGSEASLIGVEDEGSVYKIRLKIGEAEYESYVSKDGKFLFPQGYLLEEESKTEENIPGEEDDAGDIPSSGSKRDVPDVKLFVMSYCPYGLQAQKMFIPVYELLKDRAEMGIYFVDYIMHQKQEIDENLNQYCIQKEEKEKFVDYLSCFVENGDSNNCLAQVNIDRNKLSSCVSATDEQYNVTVLYNDQSSWLSGRYSQFNVYQDLNEEYGVQGSPTVVINDKIATVNPRTPEKFKEVICQSFTSQPEECSQTLSVDAFTPGFGGETGSSSGGSCQ